MALTLAACRPLAARRAQVARRAPVAARRPRLQPAGARRGPSRPLWCTAPERDEAEPAKAAAPEPQQQQQGGPPPPPPPPPPPRLVLKPPPQPASPPRASPDDKLPRPKPPLHPFLGFMLSFFSVRRVRARAARSRAASPCAFREC